MPDIMLTPFDRLTDEIRAPSDLRDVAESRGVSPAGIPIEDLDSRLPAEGWQAVLRGVMNQCPRCGEPKLFVRFLKPITRCTHCLQDWTLHSADDFPPYVAILLTGHILAPIIIALVSQTSLPVEILAPSIILMAALMVMAFLQPAKGGIIALQWWFGMHGFERTMPSGAPPDGRETQ